jgi:DNA-binding YbaB/EbfC family protein
MSMFSKLKQFKDLKDRAKAMQDMLAQEHAEGTAGWGKVKVTINGNQHVESVSIDEAAMNDRAGLEGMVKDAFNDAIEKMQKVLATKLREGGGMDIMSEFGDMLKQ